MRKLVLFLVLLMIGSYVNAQLIVNTGTMTPTQYVQNVLVGNGVAVSNITFSGNTDQIGQFNGTNTTIGIGNGLILGSGDVNGAVGPNDAAGTTLPPAPFFGTGGYGGPGDVDLDILVNDPFVSTGDAAILEFDFIATGDTLEFSYVFASEEYPEFAPPINSDFNDVFGFFLSGPGITGIFSNNSKNIALIPGTNSPVSIANINPVTNTAFYIDNGTGANAPFNTGQQYIQYDGLTVVLTAFSEVQCGETYHIKIAITDAGDTEWDSGVFIEGGSFNFSSSAAVLSSSIGTVVGDSILYEGCGTISFNFVRDNIIDTSLVSYIITGAASTSDYNISADSLVFLPGVDSLSLSFDAIFDGVPEPLESVTIQFFQEVCNTIDTQSVTFYISDYPQPILTTHDTIQACGSTDSLPIWVNVLGPPHTAIWNTGEITDTIWVNPLITTTYYVSVADTCGVFTINDSATVTIIPPSPINLTILNDTSKYCPQDSILIYVIPTGGSGTYTYNWNIGTGVTDSSLYVNPGITTTYVVDVEDACGTIAQELITVTVPLFIPLTNLITTIADTICPAEVVTLNATITGGVGTYLLWNNGLGNTIPVNVNPLTTTNYILTAMDSCGSIIKDSVTITVNNSSISVTVADYNANCINETGTLTAITTGSLGNETYLWNTGEITSSIQAAIGSSPKDFWVTATDLCATDSDTAKVNPAIFNPVVLTVNNNTILTCPNDPLVLSATINGGSQSSLIISWTDGVSTFTGNNITVTPSLTTTYTAWVIDTCANDGDTASFTVTTPSYSPLTLTISDDTLICKGDYANLLTEAIGGEGTYTYSWDNGYSLNPREVSPNFESSYSVTVTDGCGNQESAAVFVGVVDPTANFSFEYISEFTVQFTDSSYNDIDSSWWSFNGYGTSTETNPTYNFGFDGVHEVWLVVKDINGCLDSVLRKVRPPMFVYGPNSFTPNGDGLNDEFKFKGVGIQDFELTIYNRWGEMIFNTTNIDTGWRGNFKGEPLPVGVYVYRVRAESFEHEVFEGAGSVNLIR